MWKSKSIYLRVLLYGGILQILLVLYYFRKDTSSQRTIEHPLSHNVDTTNNFMNVCALPDYDYWHPDVMRFVELDNPKKKCDISPYTQLINGTWSVIGENRNCSARCFVGNGDRDVIFGEWIKPGPVDCEFLEAVCWENSNEVYGYIHTQIIVKKENPVKPKTENPPNVFVFLFDSLGFGHAKRSLPKTLSFLYNKMKSIEYPFVNKVGENSLPNGHSLWFGKLIEKVDITRFGGNNTEPDWSHEECCHTPLDNRTSIFKDFEREGYMTLAIDDWASQMVNYPDCRGFLKPPTHHYIHPFYLVLERFGMKITKHHLDGKLCRETHHPSIEYFQQFVDAYPDKPKFTWWWLNSIGHDNFNGFLKKHVDDLMIDLFKHNFEMLDNSFIFFMGDHGYRMGPKQLLESPIGSLEQNNPYLSISVPKKLRNNHEMMEMMKQNSEKLQTHFDTRATMLDILKFQPESSFSNRKQMEIPNEKGHSYLRRQPSFPRTCGTLPIPPQYCICQIEKIPILDKTVQDYYGRQLIDHVNKLLDEGNFTSMCEKVILHEVTSLVHFGHVKHKKTTHNYEITVMAEAPSLAIFQTVFFEDLKTRKVIYGSITRLDSYGKTGRCTNSGQHEKICYCKNIGWTERWNYRLNRQLDNLETILRNYFPNIYTFVVLKLQ